MAYICHHIYNAYTMMPFQVHVLNLVTTVTEIPVDTQFFFPGPFALFARDARDVHGHVTPYEACLGPRSI